MMSTTRARKQGFTSRVLARSAVALSITGGVATSVAMAACSDDSSARESFDDDAQVDGGAMVPEGAAPDAAPPADARPPFDPAAEPVKCAATPCVTDLVAGGSHFCARISDGTVRCWGDDTFGSLGAPAPAPDGGQGDGGATDAGDAGDGSTASGVRTVRGLGGVTQLSAGGATTCARLEEGGVVCWGGNQSGELGLSAKTPVFDEDPHRDPKPVALPGAAVRVDVGYGSACALLTTGKLACWGKDDREQLSRADGGIADYPYVRAPGIADVDAVAATLQRAAPASFTTLALTKAGEVWSWGAVSGGEGLVAGRVSSLVSEPVARRITELGNVTSLAVSPWSKLPDDPPPSEPGVPPPPYDPPKPRAHACAIAAGAVFCWGRSEAGALGTGIPDREPVPAYAPIKATAWPQQLAAGEEITCARMTDGTVQCAGTDVRGRLGTGKLGQLSAFFTPAEAFKGHAVHVATSNAAVCALVQGGTVECWGSNEHGELGMTTRDVAAHPSPSKIQL